MPTPEANASSTPTTATVSLRNANITELAIDEEEADSFKANNVSILMTQDQCFDNGHQQAVAAAANSNKRSSSDNKVSDGDLNTSKNSVVSNGVNIGVQEFNVDVNSEREHNTNLVIVQNRTVVDADSPPTGEVLPTTTSKQSLLTEIPLSDSKEILKDNLLNNKNNIDANKSDCAHNIIDANMTVITHQNSNENMRDIIANSEKANSNKDSSQLDKVEERSAKSDLNSRNNATKSVAPRRHKKLIRSDNVNECEDVDQAEDPIERLNKLRASISSALSEVKGVLKQYSTEQSCDDQSESAPSKQQSTATDDGPVRFRFVRKIRRRSVFSEDDETEIPKTTTDVISSPIIENKVIEEVPNEFQNIQKVLSITNHENTVPPKLEEIEKPIIKDTDESGKKLIETTSTDIQVAQDKNENGFTTVSDEIKKTTKEDSSIIIAEVPAPIISTPKIKNGKTKKIVKKDRRASIAAVEINKISNDDHQSPEIPPLELKTQRRPSDSGTLVKQPTRLRAAKTSEKPKVTLTRKTKTSSSSKTESSTTQPKNETEVKATVDLSPLITQANIPAVTSVAQSNIPEVKPVPIVSSTAKADVPKTSPKATEIEKPAGTSVGNLNATLSEPASAPIVTSTSTKEIEVNKSAGTSVDNLSTLSETASAAAVSSTSPKISEVNNIAEISILKQNKPEVAPAPAVSSKTKDELSQSIPETVVSSVKPNISKAPSLKSSPDAAIKVEIPAQQIAKQISTPISNKLNTPVPSTKIPDASPATSRNTTEAKTDSQLPFQSNKQTKMRTEATASVKASKTMQTATDKIVANETSVVADSNKVSNALKTSGTAEKTEESSRQIDKKPSETQETQTDGVEVDVPKPTNVPKDAVAVKLKLPGQESVEELQRLEEQQQDDKETTPPQTPETPETPDTTAAAPPKKKRKAKRKVVIRRIKRKLSKDDTFLHPQEAAAELEICEKEIEEKDEEEPAEEVPESPKQPKSCLKIRQYEIGDVVMYAEHYKKTQVRWKKAVVTERITSISYKLDIEGGDERPAHISYIKKFTDRKVNFGGKEYLEIDYAQIEDNEEKERNYSIWNLV